MSKGMKKFLIICAAVFIAGTVIGITGFLMGGIKDIDKVAEHYDWLNGSPGELKTLYIDGKEAKSKSIGSSFNSVSIQGDIDVIIDKGNAADAVVKYGENLPVPEMYIKNETLYIKAKPASGVININLTKESGIPTAEISIPEDKTLRNIDIDIDSGDVELYDIAAKKANVKLDCGDIECSNVDTDELIIACDSGDCEIDGKLRGITDISIDTGDIDIEAALPEKLYSIAAKYDGSLEINDEEYLYEYGVANIGSGKNKINISAGYGDICIDFAQ